jgi:hypothetical protein
MKTLARSCIALLALALANSASPRTLHPDGRDETHGVIRRRHGFFSAAVRHEAMSLLPLT